MWEGTKEKSQLQRKKKNTEALGQQNKNKKAD